MLLYIKNAHLCLSAIFRRIIMSYTHLLFDLDGTLFDFDAGEKYAFNKICDFLQLTFTSELLSLYKKINLSYWQAYERGEITTQALAIARFSDFLSSVDKTSFDPAFLAKLYQSALGEDCTPIADALSVCRHFFDNGYHLSIITNGRSQTQHNRLSKSELFQFFSGLFISEEIGFQKPSAEFFNHVLNSLDTKPSKALIIGDSLTSDITGGISYGIDTCWFNPGHKTNTLLPNKPTYEIHSLTELLKLV